MKNITATDFQIPVISSLNEQIGCDLEENSSRNQEKNKIIALLSTSKTESNNPAMNEFEMDTERLLVKHTSHTLLYAPDEHRRISITSGNSTASCPPMPQSENVLDTNPVTRIASLLRPSLIDGRRRSIHTGAPAIGFVGQKLYRRHDSQSTFILERDKIENEPLVEPILLHPVKDDMKMMAEESRVKQYLVPPESNISEQPLSQSLAKRVNWLSTKNLQGNELSSIGTAVINKRNRRLSAMFDLGNEKLSERNDSWTNNQFGSMSQLDHNNLLDKETDTPPLDTFSWSNAGSYSPLSHPLRFIAYVFKIRYLIV